MSAVGYYLPRVKRVRAMRIILGVTTRSDIRAFCPRANIGVLVVDGVDDEKDIRWVLVPGHTNCEMRNDGDWLVETYDDSWEIISDAEFIRKYTAA